MFNKAILYWSHLDIAQRMLDYDFICGNNPSIIWIFSDEYTLYKLFRGNKEIIIPCITSWEECKTFEAEVLINLASSRTASSVTKRALDNNQFTSIIVIAEGIPERETRELISYAKKYPSCTLIGPSTVWWIQSGVLRIANTWWSFDNMLKSKLFESWSIGFVSKSWGMSNEMYRIIANNSDGIHTWITIWWDRYPYSSFLDIIQLYEENPEIKIIIMLWEVWNINEIEVANLYKSWVFKKPIISRVSWESAESLHQEIQFGHAWAKANNEEETASYKNKYMKECGIYVPDNFDEIGTLISKVFEQVTNKSVQEINLLYNTYTIPRLQNAIQGLSTRKKTSFTSSICNEQGDELLYNNKTLTEYLEKWSIGNVIWNLRFKTDLPDFAIQFFNDVIIILADHGPAVSWAANAIICSRAWKNVIDSLIAGLTTIWPRFWWAIQWACELFYYYKKNWISPIACVQDFKTKWWRIPWIGHKIKSQFNPDKRCTHLLGLSQTFPVRSHIQYALEIEEITLQKRQNLILNVDWYIAAMMLDLMESLHFDEKEIEMYVHSWICNGIFAFSRSIWFIAHAVDQKRLHETLYRTSRDDILYI